MIKTAPPVGKLVWNFSKLKYRSSSKIESTEVDATSTPLGSYAYFAKSDPAGATENRQEYLSALPTKRLDDA